MIDRKHEPIYFTIQRKQQIYQRLKAGLQSGGIHLPNDDTLQDQLESIGSDETNAGNLRLYPRGENARDDHVDALALACWGLPEFGDRNGSRGAKQAVTPSKGTNNPRRNSHRGRSGQEKHVTAKASKTYTVNGNSRSSTTKQQHRRQKRRR